MLHGDHESIGHSREMAQRRITPFGVTVGHECLPLETPIRQRLPAGSFLAVAITRRSPLASACFWVIANSPSASRTMATLSP
jgi:hypothetical protein